LQLLKKVVGFILTDRLMGIIDYYRFPQNRDSWGGPLNAQMGRQKLYKVILEVVDPAALVETGTFRGTTTRYFAESGLPVYSIESDARNFGFASAQVRGLKNVTLVRADSRTGLRQLLDGPLRSKTNAALFFYLDAHWNVDLPLASELQCIFSAAPAACVMVDDFQVPGDPGYGYDSYGPGLELTADYIAPICRAFGLSSLYPVISSAEETGARRGCVVLTSHGHFTERLLATRLFCRR
jgi:hypothetical protein